MLTLFIGIFFFGTLRSVHCSTFSRNAYVLDIDGDAEGGYYITVGVGMPPQAIRLLVDTGSSNMAILVSPSQNRSYYDYKLSNTFQTLDHTLSIRYTEGSWEGFLAVDRLSLGSIPICTSQAQFSCITSSKDVFGESSTWEGILGMAYVSIARPSDIIEPFFDMLINSCNVSNIFSVSFCGPFLHQDVEVMTSGKLILGNIYDDFYSGKVLFTPILKEWYYEVMITGLMVGDTELDLPCVEINDDKSIIDTGTTFLAFPPKIYAWVIEQMKNYTRLHSQNFPTKFWTNQAIVCVSDPEDVVKSFPTIEIAFYESGNSTFSLRITPNMYLLRYLKNVNDFCLKLTIGQSDKGTIIGATVLKGFYVIFDRKNKRIGFANSTCVETSVSIATVVDSRYADKSLDCKFRQKKDFTYQIIFGITITALLIFVASLLFVFRSCLTQTLFRKLRKSNDESNLVKVVYEPS